MSRKLENPVRTLARLEVLAIQGVLFSVGMFLFGVLAMPFVPFLYVWNRWRMVGARYRKVTNLLITPIVFIAGCFCALFTPVGLFWRGASGIKSVLVAEWGARTKLDNPKKPNGSPLEQMTPEQRAERDAWIEASVAKDYMDAN